MEGEGRREERRGREGGRRERGGGEGGREGRRGREGEMGMITHYLTINSSSVL